MNRQLLLISNPGNPNDRIMLGQQKLLLTGGRASSEVQLEVTGKTMNF